MKKLYFLIIVVLIMFNFTILNNKTKAETIVKNNIGIDIKGAVNNPGYYNLEEDSTVYDAINAAGGLKSYADTSVINLSKILSSEDVIIIYTIDEVNEMKSGSTSIKIIEKECVCAKIDNVACIENTSIDISENNNKININTASLDELQTLSGIGKTKAESIIKYRNDTPFNTIEDILKVKGIGTGIFEKIKSDITV